MNRLGLVAILIFAAVALLGFIANSYGLFEFLEKFRSLFSEKVITVGEDETAPPVISKWAFYTFCFTLILLVVAICAVIWPQMIPGLEKHKGDDYVVDASSEVGWSVIQSKFIDKVINTKRPADKKVEIFGFTFIAFWPAFRDSVLKEAKVRDWKFDVYFISPSLIEEYPNLFESHWLRDARQQLESMQIWFGDKANIDALRKQNIKIRVRAHKVLPFVHGKYWADETVFVHVAQWSQTEDGIKYPSTFHEVFPGRDSSKRAEYYRALMANWAKKYKDNYDIEIVDIS